MNVVAETRTLHCNTFGPSRWPIPAESGQGSGFPEGRRAMRASRWAAVASCAAAVLASPVLVATSNAAAMGAPGATSGRPRRNGPSPDNGRPRAPVRARVPAGLRAAIDRAFAAQPATSPSGVTLSWGGHGTVWFRRSKGRPGQLELRPEAMGRSVPEALSRPFRLRAEAHRRGARRWPDGLVHGDAFGFEQASRPPGGRPGGRAASASSSLQQLP